MSIFSGAMCKSCTLVLPFDNLNADISQTKQFFGCLAVFRLMAFVRISNINKGWNNRPLFDFTILRAYQKLRDNLTSRDTFCLCCLPQLLRHLGADPYLNSDSILAWATCALSFPSATHPASRNQRATAYCIVGNGNDLRPRGCDLHIAHYTRN